MNKILILMSLAWLSFAIPIRAEGPIDLHATDNLKAVYDAGYRPWRTTPSSCEVNDKTIAVILPGNLQFSIPAQIASFSVLANDQLSSAEFISLPITTNEAVAKVHEICKALNLPVVGLDQAIPTFAERSSKPDTWNTRGEAGNTSVTVALVRLDYFDRLAAKIYVTIIWNYDDVTSNYADVSIKPPAGYENISMDPAKVESSQEGFPKHDLQYYKDLIAKKKAEAPSSELSIPSNQTLVARLRSDLVQGKSQWIYGVLILFLLACCIIGYLFWKRK